MDLFATHTLNYKVCCGFLAGCEDQSSAMNLWFKIDTRISSLFKFGTEVLFQQEEPVLVTAWGPEFAAGRTFRCNGAGFERSSLKRP